MKNILLMLIFLIVLISCKRKTTNNQVQVLEKKKHHYVDTLNRNFDYFFNDYRFPNLLFQKGKDSLDNKVMFLSLFNNGKIKKKAFDYKLPFGYMGIIENNNSYTVLHTEPHTMIKKKTNDVITKYNKNFKKEKKIDVDIAKYPSAKSFILKNKGEIIYITNSFQFKKKEKLVIRKYSGELKMVKEKIIEPLEKRAVYSPVFTDIIRDTILIVSDKSAYEAKNKTYELLKIDFNFNVLWKKEIYFKEKVTNVINFNEENNLVFVSGYKNKNLKVFNYEGNVVSGNFFSNQTFFDIISHKKEIFILSQLNNKENTKKVYQLNSRAKIILEDTLNFKHSFIPYKQRLFFSNGIGYILCLNLDKNQLIIDTLKED